MTRLAKAMSAFTHGRSASAAGRNDGRSLATRGASRGFDGSGAPSGRTGKSLLVLALAALALLAFAPAASAGKIVDRIVAGTTTTGGAQGQFDDPRGIAVNYANVADGTTDPLGASTDGYVYVVDEDRMRVQVFSPDGTFRFSWGRSVVNGGDGAQICDSSEVPCTSLTTADDEEGEFDDPQGIGINQTTGDVYVRDRDNRRVQQFEADGTFIRTWGYDVATAASPDNTGTGFEICTSLCKAGTTGGLGGQLATSSSNSTGLAVVPAGPTNAGNVIVADPGNRRIQEFSPTGSWVRAWGWDVVQPGGTGEVINQINEHQAVTVDTESFFNGLTGGTFTLTFEGQTTAPIAYDASGDAVDAALEALPTIGSGNVSVTGPDLILYTDSAGEPMAHTWTVEFTGALSLTDVPLISGDGSQIETEQQGTSATVNVSTTAPAGPQPGFEICTVATQCKAAATNSVPAYRDGAFTSSQPVHLAVDSGGFVYASDSARIVRAIPSDQNFNRIQRFDTEETLSTDLLKSSIDVVTLTSTPTNLSTTGLAVDPSNDNLFVARNSSIGVLEFSDPDGTPAEADRHYQGAGVTPNGIALDGIGDDLYLTSSHRVLAADDDGAPPAIFTISPPTNLEAHSATLNGAVNPNGSLPASYRFQYSKNGVTWTDAAPAVDLGSGTSPIVVDDHVTGLEANTFYRVRILVTKPFGNPDSISPELTFLTDAIGPELETFHPQARTETSARFAGKINPNNLSTTYYFEYGTSTKYGSKVPVPEASISGGTDQIVLADVAGLKPNTTYHVRLVATNAQGTTHGNDIIFTTRSTPPATPSRAYEMVTPPFKATRANITLGRAEYNVNPGIPSPSGDAFAWSTTFFPLTEDVGAPADGDRRIIRRTPAGWTNRTINTLAMIEPSATSILRGVSSSAEFDSIGVFANVSLLPHAGEAKLRDYTYREGTGTEGYTAWMGDTDATRAKFGFNLDAISLEPSLFNDKGTVFARAGEFRDVAEDPSTVGDDDPSGEQQIPGTGFSTANGGRTIYLQRSADPDQLPTAAKDLVNECTGASGDDPTELPARVGTGVASDTIGTQVCAESDGMPDATGTGNVSAGSAVVSELVTDSGTFAPGQIVSSPDIPIGTRVTSVSADELTLSAPLSSDAVIFASTTSGSNEITVTFTVSGSYAVGQAIVGPGIPSGTTIVAIDGSVLTLSQAATATEPFAQLQIGPPGPVVDLSAEAPSITSQRGAILGGGGPRFAPVATALSDDGSRVFFSSPDPAANGLPTSCTTGTGPSTSCPPQLFVRQYDANGENPQVRWISRSRSSAVGDGSYEGSMIAGQQIAEMGAGAIFQGASRDGSVVYFKTDAPLTPDDPNAGKSITTDQAQDNSWDLYRYELPTDLGEDPADGKLARVSGGPSGDADANAFGGVSSGSRSSPLRFLSDDGTRAYFVTRAPIAGADGTAPAGGSTTPGGAVADDSTRNLYLYDANETGADRYRFISRLPVAGNWNKCATTSPLVGRQIGTHSSGGIAIDIGNNCVRGTTDGSHIVFSTRGRLTGDDDDDSGDLYLYDSTVDELVRVTAPPPGAVPYSCEDYTEQFSGKVNPVTHCNGDLSYSGSEAASEMSAGTGETARGWGGLRNESIAKDSSGGVSVFFESRSELLPEDTNGDRYDVYQWREGELSLISPGKSNDNAWFSGNTEDGSSVFFVTTEAIDPREIDPQDFDIYVARVGGGFPYTPPPTPCDVLAFGCESEAIPAVAPRSATSIGLTGEGNHKAKPATKPRKCAKGKVRRKGKCVTKKAKRSQRAAKTTRRAGR